MRRTFTKISEEIGLTNAYTAQLFYNQVCASPPMACGASIGGAHGSVLNVPTCLLIVMAWQAQLKKGTVAALKEAVPALTDAQVKCLQICGAKLRLKGLTCIPIPG